MTTYEYTLEDMDRDYKIFKPLFDYIRVLHPNKGNNMNEITPTQTEVAPWLVEILDADGNPTGQYRDTRDSETSQEGTTVYATAEDGEHTIH